MKRSVAAVAIFALASAGVLASACRPPRDRSDWRAPVTARPCKSDSDCPSGITCAIELGASQGTCDDPDAGSRPHEYGPNAPDPHGEGGAPGPHRPQGPPINVQPQPGDINI